MPAFRLYNFEKKFLREVMNGAVLEIDSRDSQKCAEYACRALLTDKETVLGAKKKFETDSPQQNNKWGD